VLRFYGYGNETTEARRHEFYEVRQRQLVLAAELGVGDGERRRFGLGPVLRYTSSDTTGDAYITDARPYGTGSFTQAGLQADFVVDGRDVRQAPWRGYRIEGGASWYPGLFDVSTSFGEVHGQATWYTAPPGGNPTLALRVGGKRLWGTYPYSDAAFLGGAHDVRGLREQRYAGDAALYANTEVRVFITHVFFLFPMDFGVFGLLDTGRVFFEGEASETWHDAWGGGVWIAPVGREATVRASFARHARRTSVYVGMGFAY
jgi:outer membrane translocation and assembly module TamA